MCALQAPHNTYNGIETAGSTRGSRFQDSPAGGRCSPGRGAPCARIAARPRVSAPRSRVSSRTGSFGAPPLAACEASRRAPGEEGGLLTGSAAALGGAGSLAQQPPAAMPSMPLRALQVGHACLDGGLHTRERLSLSVALADARRPLAAEATGGRVGASMLGAEGGGQEGAPVVALLLLRLARRRLRLHLQRAPLPPRRLRIVKLPEAASLAGALLARDPHARRSEGSIDCLAGDRYDAALLLHDLAVVRGQARGPWLFLCGWHPARSPRSCRGGGPPSAYPDLAARSCVASPALPGCPWPRGGHGSRPHSQSPGSSSPSPICRAACWSPRLSRCRPWLEAAPSTRRARLVLVGSLGRYNRACYTQVGLMAATRRWPSLIAPNKPVGGNYGTPSPASRRHLAIARGCVQRSASAHTR
eukprot:scaffold11126_cov64-Phaeocystis_antarctica.AAC.4